MKRDRKGRIRPGYSLNPNGRPRKPEPTPAVQILFEEVSGTTQNGVEQDLSGEEALMFSAVQQLMKPRPNARAIAIVMKAILKRAIWHSAHAEDEPAKSKIVYIRERDSENAFEAMCTLGIAEPDPRWLQADSAPKRRWNSEPDPPPDGHRIKLRAWAVKLASGRGPGVGDDPNFYIKVQQHTAPRELPG